MNGSIWLESELGKGSAFHVSVPIKVVEAPRTGGEEQFGEGRLEEIVRHAGAASLPRVIERVMEELRAWSGGGGFDDDVTLLLARRRGLHSERER